MNSFKAIKDYMTARFEGCYYTERPGVIGCEKAWLKITYVDNTINLETTDTFGNKHSQNFVFSDKIFYRWDGSLVIEGESIGTYGGVEHNSQILTLIGNTLIRRVYKNYKFRGPFGGYWGASEQNMHFWHRVSEPLHHKITKE